MIELILTLFTFFFILPLLLKIPVFRKLLIGGGIIIGYIAFIQLAFTWFASGFYIIGIILSLFLASPFLCILLALFERKDKKEYQQKTEDREQQIKELTEYHKKKAQELKEKNKNN